MSHKPKSSGEISHSASRREKYRSSASLHEKYHKNAGLHGMNHINASRRGKYCTTANHRGKYHRNASGQGKYHTAASRKGKHNTSADPKGKYYAVVSRQEKYHTTQKFVSENTTQLQVVKDNNVIAKQQVVRKKSHNCESSGKNIALVIGGNITQLQVVIENSIKLPVAQSKYHTIARRQKKRHMTEKMTELQFVRGNITELKLEKIPPSCKSSEETPHNCVITGSIILLPRFYATYFQ